MTENRTAADLGPLGIGSDAARRIHDAYTLHLTVDAEGNEGRWMAFALEDGQADNTLYDSKNDAMRSKGVFAKNYGYMPILLTGCSVREAESYLRMCRMVARDPRLEWRNSDYTAPEAETSRLILPFHREGFRQ